MPLLTVPILTKMTEDLYANLILPHLLKTHWKSEQFPEFAIRSRVPFTSL